MIIGHYKIGRYHAIIKKIYEDGMISYETQFSDENDLQLSIDAMEYSIGKLTGLATKHPSVMARYEVIRGKEAIAKELENAPEPSEM